MRVHCVSAAVYIEPGRPLLGTACFSSVRSYGEQNGRKLQASGVRTSLAEPKHEHVLRACPGRDFPVDHGVHDLDSSQHILLTPHGSLHARTQTYGKSKDEAAQGRREASGRFWLTEVTGASWMSNHEGMRMPPANFIPYGIAVRVSTSSSSSSEEQTGVMAGTDGCT